ncbi:MAG: GntR family transcriptional regulator [Rhodobacteraceae bacterium]|nr:GntR family transcriptional regulator [Paracoccaceae bacterium]
MTETVKKARGAVQAAVLDKLRSGLMDGALMPGQVIKIRQFAAIFDTSAMPVRDAISQLVAANALEEMPNGSVRVPVLSPQRLQEIFELRCLLECRAARAACRNGDPDLPGLLHRINAPFEPAETVVPLPKHEALQVNRRFHFTLYQAAGSEVLMPLIQSLWMQCGPTMHLTLETPTAALARLQHLEILKGMDAGDADYVAGALAAEIEEIGSTILAGYDAALSNGPLAFADAGASAGWRT